MLGLDEWLPVLLLADGKHWHADVIVRIASPSGEVPHLPHLWLGLPRLLLLMLVVVVVVPCGASICVAGVVSRADCPVALWGAGQEAEAGGGEAGAAQVAGGVEAALALSWLGQGVRGVAHRRVGLAAMVVTALVPQLGVGEHLPLARLALAIYRAGRRLENSKY